MTNDMRLKFAEEACIECAICHFVLSGKTVGCKPEGYLDYDITKWHFIEEKGLFICPTCGFDLYNYFSELDNPY